MGRTFLLWLMLAGHVGAIEWNTNWFATNTQWRASGGVVYNVHYSTEWQDREGTVVQAANGVIVVEQRWTEPVFETVRTPSSGPIRRGNMIAGTPSYTYQRKIGERELSELIALTNYPKMVEVGWKASARSRSCGVVEFRGDRLSLYDCGMAPTRQEIEAMRRRLGYDRTNGVVRGRR